MSVLYKALEKAAQENAAESRSADAADRDAVAASVAAAVPSPLSPSGRHAAGAGRRIVRLLALGFMLLAAAALGATLLYQDEIETLVAQSMGNGLPASPAVAPTPATPAGPETETPPAGPETETETPPAARADRPAPAAQASADPAPASDAGARLAPTQPVRVGSLAEEPPRPAAGTAEPGQAPPRPANGDGDSVPAEDNIAALMRQGAARRAVEAAPASDEPPAPEAPAVTPDTGDAETTAPPPPRDVAEALTLRRAAATADAVAAPVAIDRDRPPSGVGGVSVSLTPQVTRDTIAAGYTALVRGNYRAALEAYETVIADDADNVTAHLGRAAALHRLGRPQEAQTAYERVLRLQPDNREALTNIIALVADRDPRTALTELEKLVALAPDFSPAWARLGMLRARLGDAAGAAQALRRAISLSPNNPLYIYNLAVLQDRAGRRAEARRGYEQVLRLIETGAPSSLDPEAVRARLRFLRSGR